MITKKDLQLLLISTLLQIIRSYCLSNIIWKRNIKIFNLSILKQYCHKMIAWLYHLRSMEMAKNCLSFQINRDRKASKNCLILKVLENFRRTMLNIVQGYLLILSILHFSIKFNKIIKKIMKFWKLILINRKIQNKILNLNLRN